MANTKISALTELLGTGVTTSTDFIPIVDTSATATKKILVNNLLGAPYAGAGAILQASAAGIAATLALGTARQVPMVNAGATALAYANPLTLGTEQASTSGTSIDFTGIPAGVRRITINFRSVSTNGSSNKLIQIGDSGGIETTGYEGTGGNTVGGVSTPYTTGLGIPSGSAADSLNGAIFLNLQNPASFSWTMTALIGGGSGNYLAGCSKVLSAELTQLRITTVNGTDAFDAGVINISYE